MKWVYKIWGGFDGFRPSTIGSRMQAGNLLDLGWAKYADAAEVDDEVWVFFFEGRRFEPGVYAKGHVEGIDPIRQRLVIEVTEYSTDKPLTDQATSSRIHDLVRPRKRQVFVLPDQLGRRAVCSVRQTNAPSCMARQCLSCGYWRNLPLIKPGQLKRPQLLTSAIQSYTPAYWAIPKRRNFVNRRGLVVRQGVKRTNELFYRLKSGEEGLAFLFAAGMAKALNRRSGLPAFDLIVPVPLSPEKLRTGEIHRTLALARELEHLLGVKCVDALTLNAPISKRILLNQGVSQSSFKRRYAAALEMDVGVLKSANTILLVDDVATHGNTLGAISSAIKAAFPGVELHATTGAQFALSNLVLDVKAVLAKP